MFDSLIASNECLRSRDYVLRVTGWEIEFTETFEFVRDEITGLVCEESFGLDGTVAWYFGPTLVAARGKIRSSGSSVSSATVYKLKMVIFILVTTISMQERWENDLPKVSEWPHFIMFNI